MVIRVCTVFAYSIGVWYWDKLRYFDASTCVTIVMWSMVDCLSLVSGLRVPITVIILLLLNEDTHAYGNVPTYTLPNMESMLLWLGWMRKHRRVIQPRPFLVPVQCSTDYTFTLNNLYTQTTTCVHSKNYNGICRNILLLVTLSSSCRLYRHWRVVVLWLNNYYWHENSKDRSRIVIC